VSYTIRVQPKAVADLLEITDQRVVKILEKRIDRLATDPITQGKPLTDTLAGFYSVRAAGQRYRVLYAVFTVPPEKRGQPDDEGIVTVVAMMSL
jgi:mRNA interferase RelE/StbE